MELTYDRIILGRGDDGQSAQKIVDAIVLTYVKRTSYVGIADQLLKGDKARVQVQVVPLGRDFKQPGKALFLVLMHTFSEDSRAYVVATIEQVLEEIEAKADRLEQFKCEYSIIRHNMVPAKLPTEIHRRGPETPQQELPGSIHCPGPPSAPAPTRGSGMSIDNRHG